MYAAVEVTSTLSEPNNDEARRRQSISEDDPLQRLFSRNPE